ncbi:hypothetical protein C6503_08105 [Candidatus Poribacteria bacterium]|nr:MAG: hypothetical protein C6503_08105 [Candidatus Poribacteria bacterium]
MKNSDVELIQRVLSDDDTAFSVLVRKYQRSVHTLVWRKVGDFHIAEDITQETFLKAYQKLPTLKEPQRFSGWLYVIATNCCKAWLRKKRLLTQSLENTSSEQLEKSTYSRYIIEENEQTAAETRREVIKELLAELQESERTVITLYYLAEMTHEEISEFLGVSVAAIKNRLYRARNRLKKEEPMIREALGNFQITPNLTENIMREISRLKPIAPSGGKPLVPWAIGVSTLAVVFLMLGVGNQYMSRFQKPYNFDAASEMRVELIEAPIVLSLESKPDIRTQLGSANALESNDGLNQQPDPPEDQATSEGGTISGVIKDTTLLENYLSGVRVVFINTDGAEFETQSDEEGHFERAGLPAGQYVVNIYKPGYEDRVGKPVSVIDDGRHHVPLTMNKVKISGDNDNRGGVLRFSAHNLIKPEGPMEGLEIRITGAVGLDPPVVAGITDVQGHYRSDKLSPGPYIVTIIKNDYYTICPMTVYPGKITDARMFFSIPEKNTEADVPPAQESDWSNAKNVLRGRILAMDPSDTPLSDVKVVIEDANRIVFSDTTNADGEYECRGLSPGRYLINLHKEGYIEKKGIPIIFTNNGNHRLVVLEEGMFASYSSIADGSLLKLMHGMRKQ